VRFLLLLGFLLGTSAGLLSAQATPGRAGEPGAGLPVYQNVERVSWTRLDSMRTRTSMRTTRAEAIDRLTAAIDGTLAFDASLPGLGDTVHIAANLTLRRALLRALDGGELMLVVAPSTRQFVLRREVTMVRRIRLLDAASGMPIDGAEVVVPRYARSVRAAADGWATLGNVGTAVLRVQLRALGYAPQSVALGATDTTIALVAAARALQQVVVTPGSRRALESPLAVPQAVTRAEVVARPQLAEDLFRALNRMPGMGANDYSARFNVRGARSEEVLVLLDGMSLREPFHLRDLEGSLSILDANATGAVEITPGNMTSEFGDRLTGVMQITPREPVAGETLRSAGLSLGWARVLAGARRADGRASWLVSARRGYLDLLFAITNADVDFSVTYADLFARGTWAVTPRDEVTLSLLGATDRLARVEQFDTPPYSSRYGSGYGWIGWRHTGARLEGHTTVGGSTHGQRRVADGGGPAAQVGRLDDRRSIDVGSLRTTWSWTASQRLVLRGGAEVQQQSAQYRYDRIRPTRATLFGFESRADTLRVPLDTTGLWTAGWIAPRIQFGPVVTEIGLRVDRWSWSSPTVVQPRVNLAWQVDPATTVRAATGRYAQATPLDGLPIAQGVTRWFPVERAQHVGVGLDRRLRGGLSARADLYHRALSPVSPRFVDLDQSFDVTRDLRFSNRPIRPSRGRARGVELSLARTGAGRVEWSAWYALSEIADRIDQQWVRRAIDQRHAGALDLGWHTADRRWQLNTAVVLRSGWPITPISVVVDTFRVNGRLESLASTAYGTYLSSQMPTYARLDLRMSRRVVTRGGQWTFLLDFFNVLNRRNALGYEAEIRSAQPLVWRPTLTGYVPRLPTLGVTWER
jgi:outer membrane cobalamin receptor